MQEIGCGAVGIKSVAVTWIFDDVRLDLLTVISTMAHRCKSEVEVLKIEAKYETTNVD